MSKKIEKDRKKLNLVTQETRFKIIMGIILHPKNLPTLTELSHLLNKNEGTILKHLRKLKKENIVKEITLPKEKRERDLPYKFYGFTEKGKEFLERNGFYDSQTTLEKIYKNVENKPEKVEKYEKAPRPKKQNLTKNP